MSARLPIRTKKAYAVELLRSCRNRSPGRMAFADRELSFRTPPLEEFGNGDVEFAGGPHDEQLEETHSVPMGLSEDSLLKPHSQT
jgi:hypothetical protein